MRGEVGEGAGAAMRGAGTAMPLALPPAACRREPGSKHF